MLEISQLSGGYGHMTVFREVSLHVPAGRCTAVLGPNGAGKTTLLNTVSGLLPAMSGRIHLRDVDLTSVSAWRRARRGLVLVPEGRHLFPSMTVRENLGVARERRAPTGMDWSWDQVFDLFPRLAERDRVEVRRLSGGEQQMVAIARALMMSPSVLALDEPSTGLAPQVVRQVMDVVRKLCDRGMGVLLVEQNAQEVMRIASEVNVLDHGRITWSGTPEDLQNDAALRAAYLGIG